MLGLRLCVDFLNPDRAVDFLVWDSCSGNPVGVRGQRGDRKVQGRQKMCRDRGSNLGLRN